MVSQWMIDMAQGVQESAMPNRCTILVAGTVTTSATGNRVTPYTPSAFDSNAAIPCRIMPGAGREYQRIDSIVTDREVWTVTVPAGTVIKQRDRIAIENHTPAVLDVEAVSNGGSYETGVTVLCTKAS